MEEEKKKKRVANKVSPEDAKKYRDSKGRFKKGNNFGYKIQKGEVLNPKGIGSTECYFETTLRWMAEKDVDYIDINSNKKTTMTGVKALLTSLLGKALYKQGRESIEASKYLIDIMMKMKQLKEGKENNINNNPGNVVININEDKLKEIDAQIMNDI